MIGRGLNGSAIKYVTALSPLNVAGAGSSNAIDMSKYRHITVLVATASADLVVNLERSATSNGTFSQVGLSVPGDASGTAVRSLTVTGSSAAAWYKVSYDMEGNGSAISSITLIGQGNFEGVPIPTQDTNTTVYSDVAG